MNVGNGLKAAEIAGSEAPAAAIWGREGAGFLHGYRFI